MTFYVAGRGSSSLRSNRHPVAGVCNDKFIEAVRDERFDYVMLFESSGMYRGWVTSTRPAATAIYSNEKSP